MTTQTKKHLSDIALITDVDGVMLDWFGGFAEFMIDKGYCYTGQQPATFGMFDVFPFLKKQDLLPLILEFQDSEFYTSIKPYLGVLETMSRLKRNGVKIDIVTSCVSSEKVAVARTMVIDSLYGGLYDSLTLLPLGDDKSGFFENYTQRDYTFVIDDQSIVLEQAKKHGMLTIIKDMPYNRIMHADTRAYIYADLLDILSTRLPVSLRNIRQSEAV